MIFDQQDAHGLPSVTRFKYPPPIVSRRRAKVAVVKGVSRTHRPTTFRGMLTRGRLKGYEKCAAGGLAGGPAEDRRGNNILVSKERRARCLYREAVASHSLSQGRAAHPGRDADSAGYLRRRRCIAQPRVAQRTLGSDTDPQPSLRRRRCIAQPRVAQRTLGSDADLILSLPRSGCIRVARRTGCNAFGVNAALWGASVTQGALRDPGLCDATPSA